MRESNLISGVVPSDKIAAEVVTTNDGTNYWIEDVRIIDESGRKATPPPAPQQRLAVGERVPDLPLVNQDGKTIHLGGFRGKAVLLTFVYMRCPMPNFCPRLSSQFASERMIVAGDALGRVHFLSLELKEGD